jgi:hypothetical protein
MVSRELVYGVLLLIATILSAISFLCVGTLNCEAFDESQSKWKRIKKEGEVEVFSRKVEGLDFKEYKGATQIQTSLASLVSLMDDTSAYTSWLHFCDYAKLIRQISRTERYLYLVYDVSSVPWVKDRDMVIHSHAFQNPEDETIIIKLKGVSLSELSNLHERPDFTRKPGAVRIKQFRASWTFTPVENSYVEVIYQLYVDAAPSRLVKWRFGSVMEELTYRTLRKMREAVNKARYRESNPDIIKEIPRWEPHLINSNR